MVVQTLNKSKQFVDRFDAARKLSKKLEVYRADNPLVLAIPRGGVEVGFEIAKTLGYPLQVVVSKKIGAPLHEEFGIGAVSENEYFINQDGLKNLGLSEEEVIPLLQHEQEEVKKKIKLYRNGTELSIANKTIILVDDGLATGVTVIAALLSLRMLSPKKIICAFPVVAHSTLARLKPYTDEIVFLQDEEVFESVSSFYQYFNQVSDKTVLKLLSNLAPN